MQPADQRPGDVNEAHSGSLEGSYKKISLSKQALTSPYNRYARNDILDASTFISCRCHDVCELFKSA